MEFTCGATFTVDKIDCKGLKQSVCPSQDIDYMNNVSLAAKNPLRGDLYGGCYSPCGLLTLPEWNNPYGIHNPAASPADQYCCSGAFDTEAACKTGPDENMTYTKAVHDNCNTNAWFFDDRKAIGPGACKSDTT